MAETIKNHVTYMRAFQSTLNQGTHARIPTARTSANGRIVA